MIGPLIAAFVSGEAGLAVARTKRALAAYLSAGVFALLGAIFVLIAVFGYLARIYGPVTTAGWFAIVFFLIAGGIVVVHRVKAGIEQRRIAQKRRTDLVGLGTTAAVAAIPSLMQGRRRRGAGWAAAASPVALALAYFMYRRHRGAHRSDL